MLRIYSGRFMRNELCEKVSYIPHSSQFTKEKKIERGISVTLWNASVLYTQLLGNDRSKQVILCSILRSKYAFRLCHVTSITKKNLFQMPSVFRNLCCASLIISLATISKERSKIAKLILYKLVKKFQVFFMKKIGSSPHSQELTTCLNLDPD